MQTYRAGLWATSNNLNHGRTAMQLARLIKHLRLTPSQASARGLARAIADGRWSAVAVDYHGHKEGVYALKAVKVVGGYVLQITLK